jgi:hypothetical protein
MLAKLAAEAKAFTTVIGIAAAVVAVIGGLILWEHTKWSDCLADHGFLYCVAALGV